MNDLLQTMAVAGGPGAPWAGSTENLDGAESREVDMSGSSRSSGQRMKELALSTNAIDYAALTLPTAGHRRAKHRLQVKGQTAGFMHDGGTTGSVISGESISVLSQQITPPARTSPVRLMSPRVTVR